MIEPLQHKGYIGSVEYSAQDEVFYGKIEGIVDLVIYEGETLEKLKSAFEETVDYYIDFCRRI